MSEQTIHIDRWAVGGAVLCDDGQFRVNAKVCAFVVEAGSYDEAMGRGLRALHNAYPSTNGYTGHAVSVHPADQPIDPDHARIIPKGQS